jgi:hypothetical protein
MPRIYQKRKDWPRLLPLADILKLAEDLEGFYPDQTEFIFKAQLDDETLLREGTIAKFRSELDDEDELEVIEVSIGMGSEKEALTWLHWKQNHLSLETRGRREEKVHGVFWPMEARIGKCFKAIDRNAAKSVPKVEVEVKESKVEVEHQKVEPPVHHKPRRNRWWMNPWLIAFVTATVGAVIAALIVSH